VINSTGPGSGKLRRKEVKRMKKKAAIFLTLGVLALASLAFSFARQDANHESAICTTSCDASTCNHSQ